VHRAFAFGYPSLVPSLFRRKSDQLVEDAVTEVTTDEEPTVTRPKGYTPAKGRETPKRPSPARRPAGPTRELSKEEKRELRRQARAEAAEEFRREGGPRDRGPERLLARNVVDSRRTVGPWFFGGALLVLIGSSQAMPPAVQLASNILWGVLAVAVVVDSVLLCRKLKRLIRERFPNTGQRMGSLYMYTVMRGITFRKMRAPAPQVNLGDPV